jgi:hypothetical protein
MMDEYLFFIVHQIDHVPNSMEQSSSLEANSRSATQEFSILSSLPCLQDPATGPDSDQD